MNTTFKKIFAILIFAVAAISTWAFFVNFSQPVTNSNDAKEGIYDSQVLSFTYPANMKVMNNVEFFTFTNRQNEVGTYDETETFNLDTPTEGVTYLVTSDAEPVTFPAGEEQISATFVKGYAISVMEFNLSDPNMENLPSLSEYTDQTRVNVSEYQNLDYTDDFKPRFEVISIDNKGTAVITDRCGVGGCDTEAAVFDSMGTMKATLSFVSSEAVRSNEPFEIIKDFISNANIEVR